MDKDGKEGDLLGEEQDQSADQAVDFLLACAAVSGADHFVLLLSAVGDGGESEGNGLERSYHGAVHDVDGHVHATVHSKILRKRRDDRFDQGVSGGLP